MGWIQAYRRDTKFLRGSTIAFLLIFEHYYNNFFNYFLSNYSKINHR